MQFRKSLRVAVPTLIIGLSVALGGVASHAAPGDETTYYLLTDHLGSVDVVLDDEGNVVERRDYLPYGSERVTSVQPEAPDTAQGFTGKELDDETGLQYYGARYYDPLTGRFVSVDPVVKDEGSKPLTEILSNPQALNAYSYVQNNPVRYVDPTGMYEKEVHYGLTLFLSTAAGLDYGQALTIATFDQYTDENPLTSPGDKSSLSGLVLAAKNAYNGTTGEYHFVNRATALTRLMNSISAKRLDRFGEALHSWQDTYSHGDFTLITHALTGPLPDNTVLRQQLAEDMAMTSFYLLRAINAEVNGTDDLSDSEYNAQTALMWEAIAPSVREYLGSNNQSETTIGQFLELTGQSLTAPTKQEEEELTINQAT